MVATIKLLVKLIVGIAELLEAIFPESHVLKVAERFLIRFYPIRTGNYMEESVTLLSPQVNFKIVPYNSYMEISIFTL